MSNSDSPNLQQEAADALLRAITARAAGGPPAEALERLANAYKTTVEGSKTYWQPGSKNA